jgi:polyisoprenoid-binding protein YceI
MVEGVILFDTENGAASGRIVVDATATETGNKRRDKKMHAEVLESGKHPFFVFEVERIGGTLNDRGTSRLKIDGTFAVRGGNHPMSLMATVLIEEGEMRVITNFTVPYVDWGMKDPSVFILRVDKEVAVTVEAVGKVIREAR